jgi:hypothetical protein
MVRAEPGLDVNQDHANLAIMNTAYPWPNADTAGVSSSTLSLHCSRVFYIHYQSIHALLVIWTALPRSMHNLTWTTDTSTCDRRSQSRICLRNIVFANSEHGMFMFGTTGCAARGIDRHRGTSFGLLELLLGTKHVKTKISLWLKLRLFPP